MSFLFLSEAASAAYLYHPWTNQHRDFKRLTLTPEIYSLSTNSNYDQNGTQNSISGLQGYHRLQADLSAAYAFTPELTLFARMSWVRVTLDHSTLSGNSFGLGDQNIGINYRLFKTNKGVSLDLQVQGDFPAYDNADAAEHQAPHLGDGSTNATLGAFLSVPFSESDSSILSVEAGAGYTYRSDDFSAAVPWSAELRYQNLKGNWWAGVGAYGIRSLSTDSRSNLSPLPAIPGAGGSYATNAINPQYLSANLRGGYRFSERSEVFLSGAKSMWGTNASSTTLISAGAQFNFNNAKVDGRRKEKERYEASNKGFVSYTFEARVVRTNDKLHLVKIDRGSEDGLKVGQVLDIFSVKKDGSIGEAVARSEVVSVKPKEAALKVTEYFREVWIEERFIVKRPLN